MEHLEGRESIYAALLAHQRTFELILVSQSAHAERFADLLDEANRRGVPVRHVDRAQLDAMAHGTTHGGIVAIVSPKPRLKGDQLLEVVDRLTEPPLLLLLEGIDDARNLAFTLRSADAMGAHGVLIKKHLWDFDPVEVSRPSSGAYERLPLAQLEGTTTLKQLQQRGMRLTGCIAGVKRTIYDIDLTQPTIVAIGGEKRGLSGAVREICDVLVTIPTAANRSLSLSHAAAVALGEAMRQRRAS